MLPLVLVFGSLWGATRRRRVAVVARASAYGITWIVILVRAPRRRPGSRRLARREGARRRAGSGRPTSAGPASHAPEVAEFLLGARAPGRGRDDRGLAPLRARPYPVRFVARSVPVGLRHLRAAALISRRAKENDVVYATGMLGRTTAGVPARAAPVRRQADPGPRLRARAAPRPLHGLARRLPAPAGRAHGGAAARAPATSSSHRAAHVICPSGFLARLTRRLGRSAGPGLGAGEPDSAVARAAGLEPRARRSRSPAA